MAYHAHLAYFCRTTISPMDFPHANINFYRFSSTCPLPIESERRKRGRHSKRGRPTKSQREGCFSQAQAPQQTSAGRKAARRKRGRPSKPQLGAAGTTMSWRSKRHDLEIALCHRTKASASPAIRAVTNGSIRSLKAGAHARP